MLLLPYAEGYKTRTYVLPSGHEPLAGHNCRKTCSPAPRSTHKSENLHADDFVLNLGTGSYQQRGQQDLEHMFFVIYFNVLAHISYTDLTLTDKS